jgi:hypothetical protein
MATISKYYKKTITDLLATKSLKVALLKNTFTLGAGHQYYTDINGAFEVAGTGYTAGGNALATLASSPVGDNAKFTAAATTFAAITLGAGNAARYAVVYNTADNTIISEHDLGADKSPSGGSLIITWNASGILTVS